MIARGRPRAQVALQRVEHAGREQHEQSAAEQQPVDHEGQERALRDVGHESGDDGETDAEGDDRRRRDLDPAERARSPTAHREAETAKAHRG